VLAQSLLLRWNPLGDGRFLLTGCALAAPLLGLLAGRPTRWRHRRQALALLLVAWTGTTGLYVALFNHLKPVSALAGRDRLGLMIPNAHQRLAFFRAVDAELGPTATVAVYGDVAAGAGRKGQWEYPLFGARFARTVVPLVADDHAQRMGLRRPLAWSNERLLAAYSPRYIAVESRLGGMQALPRFIPDRCVEVPRGEEWSSIAWELWRCDDRDGAAPPGG
jgi:hypothetical protein